MPQVWIRICQECGNKQKSKPPAHSPPSDAYCNSKCRKCGSEGLDYGSYITVDDQGKQVLTPMPDDEEES